MNMGDGVWALAETAWSHAVLVPGSRRRHGQRRRVISSNGEGKALYTMLSSSAVVAENDVLRQTYVTLYLEVSDVAGLAGVIA